MQKNMLKYLANKYLLYRYQMISILIERSCCDM